MSYPRNFFLEQAKKKGHSYKFVHECLAYVDKLEAQGLPVIFDFSHLALALGMDSKELNSFLSRTDSLYAYFTIAKKNGGRRRIMAPYNTLRDYQLWIKSNILDKMPIQPQAMAFVAEKSIVNNAKVHENAKFIRKFDLKNFYESISIKQVSKVFANAGYDNIVAWTLAKLCTTAIDKYRLKKLLDMHSEDAELFEELREKESFLVQGAPTSPSLSNLICKRLDKRLQGLADKCGCSYSRYADDLTFSSNAKATLPKKIVVKSIIKSEGFELNENKTKTLHAGQRMEVTGLLVNDKIRVCSKYKRDIYRHLRFCQKFGGKPHFARVSPGLLYGKEWLHGRILFVNSVEPDIARDMMKQFDNVNWLR